MKELRCLSSLLYLVCRSEELLQDSEGGSESYDVVQEMHILMLHSICKKIEPTHILRWLSIIFPFN